MKVELFPFQKRALADIRMKTAEAMAATTGHTLRRWSLLLRLPVQARPSSWPL